MSIVSVYCKSLLRLFIVGVYCKYLLCFIVFSVQNVARSLVLLRFRLQMLLFSVFYCVFAHTCAKNIIKLIKRAVFCISTRQTLCFTVANFRTREKQHLILKNCSENAFLKTAFAIGGRLAMKSVHALCVFLCSPLFEPK